MKAAKKNRVVANTELPSGARLLVPPIKKSIGNWVDMEYDATVERLGLTWLRVKGGFGDHGDREDWVADVPSGCVSVHDYQWREPRWGLVSYESFDDALRGEIKTTVEHMAKMAVEFRRKAANADRAVEMLRAALKR